MCAKSLGREYVKASLHFVIIFHIGIQKNKKIVGINQIDLFQVERKNMQDK